MGKVLEFPNKFKPENPPKVDTDAIETRENRAWCESLSEGLVYHAIQNLQNNGFDLIEENTIVQLPFMAEVIKSVVYAEKDIHHPLQDFAETFITLTETKTPKGEPAIKGEFDNIGLQAMLDEGAVETIITDEPEPPVAS